MKTNNLKVVLNISTHSIPEKISFGRARLDNIIANPTIFTNPVPTPAELENALDELLMAYTDAAEGNKTKTAIMYDKEKRLVKHLTNLAHYVELIAGEDEEIVHLAGFKTKKIAIPHYPEFSVKPAGTKGAVRLRVKARQKTIYYWQLNDDPAGNAWQTINTTNISNSLIGDLESGKIYRFRVLFVCASGQSYSEEKGFFME